MLDKEQLQKAATLGGQHATFRRWLDDDVQAHVPPMILWKDEITVVPPKDNLQLALRLTDAP